MAEQVVIDAGVLAHWFAKDAPDVRWTVDGETSLEAQLDLPCSGSALAEAVLKHGGELLVLIPQHGAAKAIDDPGRLAAKDLYGARVFQLAWRSEPDRPWVVAEDVGVDPALAASH